MKIKSTIFIPILALIVMCSACGDYPVFTDLETNRLQVIFKGTYESNNPKQWDIITDSTIESVQDDSVTYYPNATEDIYPTHVMIDIAEMRLKGKKVTKFSLYRQTKKIELIDDTPFFNGSGIALDCDDLNPDNSYHTVYFYMRKMLFNNAMLYTRNETGWDQGTLIKDVFEERDVEGFNFNSLQVNSYFDRFLADKKEINRAFPLKIPIVGNLKLAQDKDGRIKKSVLEIRLVVKNFVKKYEYEYDKENNILKIYHFYALSDWLRDVQKYDLGKSGRNNALGGNMLAVARYYIPSEVGRITGLNSTAYAGYVIALPEGLSIDEYITPSTASSRTDNPCNMPGAPQLLASSIEATLDYYLDYEDYKYKYKAKLATCSDAEGYGSQELFESSWDTYETTVENYKIPPLVTYVASGGNYSIENVMPGNYNIYFFPELVNSYGKLYREADVSSAMKTSVSTVTVTTGVDSTAGF